MLQPVKQTNRFLFILLLIGCISIPANSQLRTEDYHITFLTTDNGLTQSTNFSILEDRKGYIWLSSQDGIIRYDGKSFFHFSDSFYYEDGNAPKQIYGLVEDAAGDIWMGSRKSLYRYSQYKNVFQKIDVPAEIKPNTKTLIAFASVGEEVWFMADDLCFMAVNIRTLNIRTLYDVHEQQEVITPFILFPEVTAKGIIWMANGNRLYGINPSEKSLKKYVLKADNLPEGNAGTVKSLTMHQPSGMIALATDKGLLLFDTKQKKQQPLPAKSSLLSAVDTWHVKAGEDGFWVSNEHAHLIKLPLNGDGAEMVLAKEVLDNEVHRGSATSCIYVDRWGRLWLNANGEYTAIIDFSKKFFRKVGRGKQGGLLSGTIQGITVSDSIVWVSDTYLSKINRTTGKVEKIFAPADFDLQGYFRQIYYDSLQQRIWFNTSDDLCYYSLKDGSCTKTGLLRNRNLSVDYLRNFIELPGQKLLMVRIDGVYELNRQNATARLLPGFDTSHIHHLARLSRQRLAFAVVGQPLRIYAYADDLSVRELKQIDIPQTILMTSEDSAAHLLWVATEKGVYKLDNTNFAVLSHYTMAQGMANDFVYAVIPDKYGWVWCSTNKGIVAINEASGEIRNFDKEPNLQSLEYNNRAFAADRDGYIYFGGVKGLNYFKPPFIPVDTIQPRLVIEEILLNNQAYRTDINPDLVNTVAFDYSPVPLTFKVLALHLVKSSGLKVVYRLNGQQQWTEIENGGYISMFNLAAGNYLIELSYREGNQNVSTTVRQIQIKIHPPFYSTWWFIISLTTIVMLAVLYGVGRNQKRKLEKLQKENEIIKLKADRQLAIAKERERITADLHDDVGATLSSLNIYGDLAHSIWDENPEKSKEMVGKIAGQSRELMFRMSDIIWSMKPEGNDSSGLTPRIRNFAQELLSGKGIMVNISIDETTVAGITNPMVRKNIILIIKESLNNAAKYSSAAHVEIFLGVQENEVQLSIQDDGKGFDRKIVIMGNGLENMANRCRQMGGDFCLESTPGEGTKITCSIPLAIISYNDNK